MNDLGRLIGVININEKVLVSLVKLEQFSVIKTSVLIIEIKQK